MGYPPVFYIYPINRRVSFSSIAEYHIRELRKYFKVEAVDEDAITVVMPVALYAYNCVFFIHPYFYIMMRFDTFLAKRMGRIRNVIGIDVANSDRISDIGLRLAEKAEAMVVPSNFAKRVFIDSGYKKPVYVIPHGVPDEWIGRPPPKFTTFRMFAAYKAKYGKKIIQTWVMHSWYRKGEDLVYEIFNRLVKERNDVAILIRRPLHFELYDAPIRYLIPIKSGPVNVVPAIIVKSHPRMYLLQSYLKEEEIEELMGLCDIYLLTSRGGGFEHPPLLAMAKSELVLGAKGGAWEEYMPDWCLVDSHKSPQIFIGDPIHIGSGVQMDVEKAVDMLHVMLDNLNDYKARMKEYVETRVREEFTWSRIGVLLKELVEEYANRFLSEPVIM